MSEVRLLLSGQPWSAQGAPSHLRLSAGLRQAADTRYTQFSKYIILEILVWDRNFCFMYLSGGGGPVLYVQISVRLRRTYVLFCIIFKGCMMMMIYSAQV